MVPHLTVAYESYHRWFEDLQALKLILAFSLMFLQLFDWGRVRRICRLGPLGWCLTGALPAFLLYCLAKSPRTAVIDTALFVQTVLVAHRLASLLLSTHDMLLLALGAVLLSNVQSPPAALPSFSHQPLKLLALATANVLISRAIAAYIKLLRPRSAHCDVNAAEVEGRSAGMAYLFTEPNYNGRQWGMPVGTHRMSWLMRSFTRFQCRSIYIPSGMQVELTLENGIVRPFDSSNPFLPVGWKVNCVTVREVNAPPISAAPPSWALVEEDSDDDVADWHILWKPKPLSRKRYEMQAEAFTAREVNKLRRSPEYRRMLRAKAVRKLLIDLSQVSCAVAQVWYGPDVRLPLTAALACGWAALNVFR